MIHKLYTHWNMHISQDLYENYNYILHKRSKKILSMYLSVYRSWMSVSHNKLKCWRKCVCVWWGGGGVIEPHKQACPTSLLPLFTKKGGRGKIMIQNKEKKLNLLTLLWEQKTLQQSRTRKTVILHICVAGRRSGQVCKSCIRIQY